MARRHSVMEMETELEIAGNIPLIQHHDVYVIADRPPFRDYAEELAVYPFITVYFDLYFYEGGSWVTVMKNFHPSGIKAGD